MWGMDPIKLVGALLALLGGYLLWQFPRYEPKLEDNTGLAVEDGTPVGDGLTAGQARIDVRNARKRSQMVGGVGLAMTIIGTFIQAMGC